MVAVTVSIISFALLHLSGDLAQSLAGPSATAADVEQVRKAYGLDRPLVVQYAEWIAKAVRGDFGESFFLKVPVGVSCPGRPEQMGDSTMTRPRSIR